MDWKQYEQEIFDHFRDAFNNANVTRDAKIPGTLSKSKRQIDVLVEEELAGEKVITVIDGKYWQNRIDVKDVESFIGMLNDVGAKRGIMITTEGYSAAAIQRAYRDEVDLELDILNFQDLKSFQAFGAIPYSGSNGVLLPAPLGWIVDGTRRSGSPATLYQRGLDLKQAQEQKEWMYVNFWAKDNEAKDLDSLVTLQDRGLKEQFPQAEIVYHDGVHRERYQTKLRTFTEQSYPAPEHTGFVEFESFIFFCVLFAPEEHRAKNLRKLAYVMAKVLPIGIKQES